MDQQRDHRDDKEHHHTETVDHDAGVELDTARLQPLGRFLHCDVGVDLVTLLGSELADCEHDGIIGATVAIENGDGLLAVGVELEVVAMIEPGDTGEDGEDEADRDGSDTELGALERHLLPEEENQHERDRWQQRDQPGVLEEPVGVVGDGGDVGNRVSGERCEHGGLSPSAGRPR